MSNNPNNASFTLKIKSLDPDSTRDINVHSAMTIEGMDINFMYQSSDAKPHAHFK